MGDAVLLFLIVVVGVGESVFLTSLSIDNTLLSGGVIASDGSVFIFTSEIALLCVVILNTMIEESAEKKTINPMWISEFFIANF